MDTTEVKGTTIQLAEHFFRHEYARMVAVITKYFGPERMNMAEDVVQETLLEAIKSWEFQGIPNNPSAWLYKVAKNKTLNILQRDSRHRPLQTEEDHEAASSSDLFNNEHIEDDQLKMMFVCCHPSINQESQIALILKTLCGLSIGEIAKAFLSSNYTINKRLVRARTNLRDSRIEFELPQSGSELESRLESVLKTVYLLFSEGYSASKGPDIIRYELCLEAIRLSEFLMQNDLFKNNHRVNGLLALMYLNASRFNGRVDKEGEILDMAHQDRSQWNQTLINKGLKRLEHVPKQGNPNIYAVMATISAYHCTAPSFEETRWNDILGLYDALVLLDTSPMVKLNRCIALAKAQNPETAIQQLLELSNDSSLENYHLFHTTLGTLYLETEEYTKAHSSFSKALKKTEMKLERSYIDRKLKLIEENLK